MVSTRESEAFLEAAYELEDKPGIRKFYKAWAKQYDRQMEGGLGYLSPESVAGLLSRHLDSELGVAAPVVDIGCGTGLVGQALVRTGFNVIDGIDFSEEMLEVAQNKGYYRNLIRADLTANLEVADNTYAAVVSAGTFTHGHVGAEAFDELLRIVVPDGLLVFTVHFDLWESAGFNDKFASMQANGLLQEVERLPGPFFDGRDDKHLNDRQSDTGTGNQSIDKNDLIDEGWFCIYRKVKSAG